MKAQDFMQWENQRGAAVEDLIKICVAIGLDYSFTEKEFVIKLPYQEPVPVTGYTPVNKRGIDWDKIFGPDSGIHEDELPPVDETLNEGETPDETR